MKQCSVGFCRYQRNSRSCGGHDPSVLQTHVPSSPQTLPRRFRVSHSHLSVAYILSKAIQNRFNRGPYSLSTSTYYREKRGRLSTVREVGQPILFCAVTGNAVFTFQLTSSWNYCFYSLCLLMIFFLHRQFSCERRPVFQNKTSELSRRLRLAAEQTIFMFCTSHSFVFVAENPLKGDCVRSRADLKKCGAQMEALFAGPTLWHVQAFLRGASSRYWWQSVMWKSKARSGDAKLREFKPLRQTCMKSAVTPIFIHELLRSIPPKRRFDYLASHHQLIACVVAIFTVVLLF